MTTFFSGGVGVGVGVGVAETDGDGLAAPGLDPADGGGLLEENGSWAVHPANAINANTAAIAGRFRLVKASPRREIKPENPDPPT